jgi:coiled-coil domain-containing protein 55
VKLYVRASFVLAVMFPIPRSRIPSPDSHSITNTMSLKFGLNLKNKLPNSASKPIPGKKKPLLDNDDEEDDNKIKTKTADGAIEIGEFNFDDLSTAAPEPSKPKVTSKPKGQPLAPPTRKPQARKDDPSALGNAASLQESERRAKEAVELDPSVYDYDAAYEALHARTAAKKAAEQNQEVQAKPKYIENLFESAELRKKDQLRARDKVLKREREAEGDEFADKEKFVTGAYKAQQEETRKAEEEEKKRQAIEEEKRKKSGMAGFHRHMLMEEEKRHQEAQAAMEAAAKLPKSELKPEDEEPKEKTDAEIARELAEKGVRVIMNEEGQVADKRQLLNAGLNVVTKPKSATAASSSARPVVHHPGNQGRNAGQRAVRERQTAMVAQQIEQAAKRKADEEAEEQRKIEHASKSRKTEGDISSAKERYLQRKKEAAAAKAGAGK